MRKILVSLLLVMTISVPVFVSAQESTEVPTIDAPTQEVATSTPDVITATPSPTEEPTVTPLPTETAVPPVPPIDQSKVFESVYSTVMVLIVGAVMIGLTGIVGLLLLLAPAVRAVLMGGIKVGIDEAGKVADKTETPLDNLAVEELRKLYLEIEKRLRAAEEQVTVNAENIAVQAQQISNR